LAPDAASGGSHYAINRSRKENRRHQKKMLNFLVPEDEDYLAMKR
jgi:hypothetical protein